MREFALCKELSLKLAKDLGFTPISFGKTSLTHPDLLTNIIINTSDEDGNIQKVSVWYGEAVGAEGILCGLLAGLDIGLDNLECVFVLGFKDFEGNFQPDEVRLSFHYDWSDETDSGMMVMKADKKWVHVSLAQRLKIVLGFETMIQEGCLWKASVNIPEELRQDLLETMVDEKIA